MRDAIAARLAQVGLELHPDKTRIVYCKDDDRPGSYERTRFTFLGYEFGPRLAKNRHGKHFVSFLPAVSTDAKKAMGREIRSWHLAGAVTNPSTTLPACSTASCRGGSTITALLPLRVALLPPAAQHAPGAMGQPEIQTAQAPRTPRHGLAGRDRPAISPPVCALASRRTS